MTSAPLLAPLWQLSWRADQRARLVADEHYNRQKKGAKQFAPPGRCMVLYRQSEEGRAFWITSWPFARFVKHQWAGAWVCSAFRNEGAGLSSELIRDAVAHTRWYALRADSWRQEPEPAFGMITFVDPTKTRHKRDPGRCFRKAGFKEVGTTKAAGLIALRLDLADMPAAKEPSPKLVITRARMGGVAA